MEDAHELAMSLQRAGGRLTGRCCCGAVLEAESMEQLRQDLAEHGLREVPRPRLRDQS